MLIANATIITWQATNHILQDHAMLLENDRISEIDTTKNLTAKYPNAERLDARGQYVLPGNICAHAHFYGAYARGMAIPGPAPKDFPEILQKLWWPSIGRLTRKASNTPSSPASWMRSNKARRHSSTLTHPPTPLTAGKLPWHIIFGVQQIMVTTIIVAGKVLMKDRELLTLQEKEVSAKAREIAPKVWKRYQKEVAKVL